MKYLLIFIIFLLGLGIYYTRQPKIGASTTYEEVSPVIIIGQKGVEYFRNDKEIKQIPISVDEYKALGTVNAPTPKLDGYIFWRAELTNITSTPILKDLQYYPVGIDAASSTLIKIKLPGEDPKVIRKEDLSKKVKEKKDKNFAKS